MREGYHRLDEDIFHGLLQGQIQALLLFNHLQPHPLSEVEDDGRDQWLVNSCLELDLPVIDQTHPLAIPGYLLFFINDRWMAEFAIGVDQVAAGTTEGLWRLPPLQRFLGEYLKYPAEVIHFLFKPRSDEDGEMIVRHGMRRFRIGLNQAKSAIERLWLMCPKEANITYLEYITPDLQDSKIYDVIAHDKNRLDRVIEDCLQELESTRKTTMFHYFRNLWKRG